MRGAGAGLLPRLRGRWRGRSAAPSGTSRRKACTPPQHWIAWPFNDLSESSQATQAPSGGSPARLMETNYEPKLVAAACSCVR